MQFGVRREIEETEVRAMARAGHEGVCVVVCVCVSLSEEGDGKQYSNKHGMPYTLY